MKNSGHFFRELMYFRDFFFKTSENKKSIVFYTERKGYYTCFEGIIKELIEKHNQNISYVTSDYEDPILKTDNPGIKSFYIKALLPIFFSLVKCRVFVMTLTDLNQFHLKRSVHPVHYVYVFHSLVSTHMAFRAGSFDHYDSILCPGPQQLREIRKYEEIYGLKKKQLIKGGYYRLEKLYNEYKNYKKNTEKNADNNPTVLIAPSWGDNNLLQYCGEELIAVLLDAGFNVIVRPHSEIVKRKPEIPKNLEKKFGDNQKFKLEISHFDDSLLKADVLISDYSGIALSYAFGTGKPVLFIDVPRKIKNPKFEELKIEPLELSLRSKIGVSLPPDKLSTAPKIIKELIKNTPEYSKKSFELRDKYIYAFGSSSEAGARHIMGVMSIKNERQNKR